MAELSSDRSSVLCGRCRTTIAFVKAVRDELRDGTGLSEPYRVLLFGPGWRRDEQGVWLLAPKARSRLSQGYLPYEHPRYWLDRPIGSHGGKQPIRLPVHAVCPGCRARQRLDPHRLEVHAGDRIDEAVTGPYFDVPDPTSRG